MELLILAGLGLSAIFLIYRHLAKEAKTGKCAGCKMACSQNYCRDYQKYNSSHSQTKGLTGQ